MNQLDTVREALNYCTATEALNAPQNLLDSMANIYNTGHGLDQFLYMLNMVNSSNLDFVECVKLALNSLGV